MFASRQSHNLKNKVHERSLRLIINVEDGSFEILLQNNKDITTHQRNLQILRSEVYKIIKREALAIMKNLFILGVLCYRTPYLGVSLSEEYKHQNSVGKTKEKIKNWICEKRICRLCHTMNKILILFDFFK